MKEREENKRLRKRLGEFLTAYDSGDIQIRSEEVSRNKDIPYQPWHEEWVYLAKEDLKETS